jgi:hypothetical protein
MMNSLLYLMFLLSSSVFLDISMVQLRGGERLSAAIKKTRRRP